LDSSIPSAYYNDKDQERQWVTQRAWHERLTSFHLKISNVTIRELNATTNKRKKRKLLALVKGLDMLMLTPACIELANEYLRVVTMTKNDAFHTAIATLYECDILLSWNFTHMVNYNNQQKINGINLLHAYRPITIISPYEL